MNISITHQNAESTLTNLVVGSSIDKITYYVTGWELRLIGENTPEINLYASEIAIQEEELWWKSLKDTPINLQNANEKSDTISALVLFTVVNKWPVKNISVDGATNLKLTFTNGCSFTALAEVEMIDWTWEFRNSDKDCIIICDSGSLYGNPKYLTTKTKA